MIKEGSRTRKKMIKRKMIGHRRMEMKLALIGRATNTRSMRCRLSIEQESGYSSSFSLSFAWSLSTPQSLFTKLETPL